MNYFASCLVVVASALVYKIIKTFEVPEEIKHIPQVSIFAFIRSLFESQSFDDRFDKIIKPVLSKHGYARLWMQGRWDLVISDPKHAREILGNSDIFLKQVPGGDKNAKKMLASKFIGSSNIVAADGHEWRRHRRIVNPALKKSWEPKIFGECTLELIKKLNDFNCEPIIIHSLFQKLTLDVLGCGMFSYEFEAVKKGDASYFLRVYSELMSGLFNPIYFIFPFLEDLVPSRKYHHEKCKEFRGFLKEIVNEREIELSAGAKKDDLLSLMIKASMDEMEEENKLSEEEVINDLATFFIAGHDTTANTLTTTFYYLARHQEIQEKARQEVVGIMESSILAIPTSEQLKSMTYIDCIIKESMRIITTATQMRRYCKTKTTLEDGLVIPANTFVNIHSWAIHHDSNIFPDPEKFIPDRYLEKRGEQDNAWMAFGTGPRMCPGLNFSKIEQKVVMSMLLKKFTVQLGPNTSKLSKPAIKSLGLTHPIDMDVCFIPRT